METTNNIRQNMDNTTNDSTDQSSSSNNISSTILTNTEDLILTNNSQGFEPRLYSISERLSSLSNKIICGPNTSTYQMIKRHFDDSINASISNQQRRHFRQHFGYDICDKTYTIDEFRHLLQIKHALGIRFFSVFNVDQAYQIDSIPGPLVFRIVRLLWNAPVSVKIFILFKLFDVNNINRTSINETRSVLENCLTELGIFKDQKRLKEAVDIFLQVFSPINNDIQQRRLNFDRFYEVFQQNPNISKSLTLIGLPDPNRIDEKDITWYQKWWILKDHTVWHIIARVGGILINFNFAVSIFLMLKQLMTIIRRTYFLRLIIPVDDHIDAHRFIGKVLAISTIIHTIGHVVHFVVHMDKHSWVESIFTTSACIGWVGHSAPITGIILIVFLMVMIIFSLQCVRQRAGFYQAFYYTHLLFWPMFVLLIIHAKDFWKWTIGPMSLFVIEKIYLLKRYLRKSGRTRLISVRIEDDKVLTLIIERPKHFTFHTGDYVNICFPNIASMQWHPFTISSAPERQDILRINIMKKKNWTRKVYDHFYERLNNLNDNNDDLTEVEIDAANNHTDSNPRNILLPQEIQFSADEEDAIIFVEGPFSSCTSYMFDCEHVVLIGAGIGITPSISALDSIIHQLKEQCSNCSQCGAPNYKQGKFTCQNLKKVDFFWVTRSIKDFFWFRSILNEFEIEQETYLNATTANTTDPQEQRSRYLDIHLYCTAIGSNEQAMLGNVLYDLVTNMYEYREQKDMHTQLRTRTHVGRPLWRSLFDKFKGEHQSTNVFFTGSAMMRDAIKGYCDELGFPFRNEPGF